MTKRCSAVAVLLLAVADHGFAQTAQPSPPKSTLIRAARLLNVKDGVYATNQGIWIEGEKIKAVGAFDAIRAQTPKDAAMLDLGPATVLPGLIDCHAHLLDSADATIGGSPSLILTLNTLSPARRALLGAGNAREDLEGGFTTVRVVGHSGVDGDVALRDAILAGHVTGPRIAAAARKITPPGGQAIPVQSSVLPALLEQDYLPVNGPLEAREAVREDLRVGADVIKVVADDGKRVLDEDEMKAIVEEAHRVGVKVAVHATTRLGIQTAINARADSIEHGDEATQEQLQAMRDNGIFLDPTEFTPQQFLDLVTKTRLLSPEDRAEFVAWFTQEAARLKSRLELARKIGVKIVAGSDMWWNYPGKTRGQASLLTLQAMQEHGMPPAEVLRAATLAGAELLGWQDRVGSIEAGKYADLIALDGDPLANVGELDKVKFVMKGGAVVRNDLGAPAR